MTKSSILLLIKHHSELHRMSFLKLNKTIDNPLKIPEKKLIERKALPLPILSLQTKGDPNLTAHEDKKIKVQKPPIREKFKKILEILNKPERKNQCIPANFINNTAQSRELVRKRLKTNFQFYHSKVEHLQLRTEIANALRKIELSYKTKPEEGSEIQCSKLSVHNLQRTIRFRKRSKISFEAKPNRFMKWESFCTSISYHNKHSRNLSTLELKKKLPYKSQIKKRSQSTLSQIDKAEVINGWEDGPVRYATDIGRVDFSDIYE